MFTILHRASDGSETLYEAESVYRMKRADEDASIPPIGDIVLQGVSLGDVPASTLTIPCGAPRSNHGFDPQVFVMNRFGATVARYAI